MRRGDGAGRVGIRLTSGVAALALAVVLASCASLVPESRTPAVPPQQTALTLGVRAGPSISHLGLAEPNAGAALASFRESCPRAIVRTDGSGLTRPEDWRPACRAAANWGAGSAVLFFASYFETLRVGEGRAHATGYFEPEIAGVRTRQPGYDIPVYALPADLVRARIGEAPLQPNGQPPLGRYDPRGQFVPYHDRAAIDRGALAGRGLEIAWVADPVEFFFLQVQGSGRLHAPDGSVMRIGYAGQNGYPYTGIGSVMKQRGLIGPGPGQYSGSMQGIMQYVREHPADGQALMEENQSYVFFTEVKGDGPLGALNVPVRPGTSVAADPRFVPLGAPVWLDVDRHEADGLWIAQDTGGAIRGANRFDTFWGAGPQARVTAGGMSGRGEALVLVPNGTLARLAAP